jgi:hypothetical protein
MFGGYLSAYYLAFALVWQLPSHPRPWSGGFVLFCLGPLFITAITLEPVACLSRTEQEKVRHLFRTGGMRPAVAYMGGLVIGLVAVRLALGIGFGLSLVVEGLVWSVVVIVVAFVPVVLGSVVGASSVVTRAYAEDPDANTQKEATG